jgi:hypothetical protein
MANTLHDRLEAAYDYLRSQLAEGSTVRGIVTLVTLGGGTLAKWPPDVTVTIALVVSQVFKIVLPDDLPEWLHLPRWPWSAK